MAIYFYFFNFIYNHPSFESQSFSPSLILTCSNVSLPIFCLSMSITAYFGYTRQSFFFYLLIQINIFLAFHLYAITFFVLNPIFSVQVYSLFIDVIMYIT